MADQFITYKHGNAIFLDRLMPTHIKSAPSSPTIIVPTTSAGIATSGVTQVKTLCSNLCGTIDVSFNTINPSSALVYNAAHAYALVTFSKPYEEIPVVICQKNVSDTDGSYEITVQVAKTHFYVFFSSITGASDPGSVPEVKKFSYLVIEPK